VRCPICKRETTWDGNSFRPFCSERCRLIDLDNWLAGRYAISTPVASEAEPATGESAGSEVDERDVTAGE
jgi:endogenous inhibitor of DNA gyrase (YacG/DUF329 family)